MDKKNLFLLISVVLMVVISACTTYQYKPYEAPKEGEGANQTPAEEAAPPAAEEAPEGAEEIEETEEAKEEETAEEETEVAAAEGEEANVVAYEGDLIDLKPYVMDPDGDIVTLGFTSPFDEKGLWQTKEGDGGFYSIIVTATDNKDSFVTKQMTVNVLVRNKPPVIEIPNTLEFKEGDLVILNPTVTDEDNAEVFVTYAGWMTSKTYQTTYDDAGEYQVTIRADDGKARVYKEVAIVVSETDREPEIKLITEPKITVTEEDLVEIKAEATDPDGDKVTLAFSEPLGESGKWQTKRGDAGTYTVKVTASDGTKVATEEVMIEVLKKNTAPVIESVTVSPETVVLKKPGDKVTVRITVVATDIDGDDVELTYSGYMDSDKMTVEYGDKGGLKTVTVTASDGKESVSKEVSFEMNNWPCFECQ